MLPMIKTAYCKISNISCFKSQNINDSRLILGLSPPNAFEPGVKLRMKMWMEQNYIWMINYFIANKGAT